MFDGNHRLQNQAWNLGDQVEITVESPLYAGSFSCQIVGINSKQGIIQTSFPKSRGKLVLIPVGTVVSMTTDDGYSRDQYTVIDRTSGENRCLVLQTASNKGNRLVNFIPEHDLKMLTVCSGKGGVGKTTIAINLALALAATGQKVCIFDAALGNANADILLDITPRYNLAHVIAGECRLIETLLEVGQGVYLLPGCSGVQQLTEMTDYEYNRLAQQLNSVSEFFDIVIIDTLTGISRNVTNFIFAAQKGCIVTTTEPHAITGTYALLKALACENCRPIELSLVVNRVELRIEAENTAEKLQFAAQKFLDFPLKYGGFIAEDYRVRQAIAKQKPVLTTDPTAFISGCFRSIGQHFFPSHTPHLDEGLGEAREDQKIEEQGLQTEDKMKIKYRI